MRWARVNPRRARSVPVAGRPMLHCDGVPMAHGMIPPAAPPPETSTLIRTAHYSQNDRVAFGDATTVLLGGTLR